jgi:hypothetical protein
MMDLNNFLNSLTDEQKLQLANALISSTPEAKKPESKVEEFTVKTTQSPKKPASVGEDFIVKKAESHPARRKESVKAKRNQWEDTGEFKDIHTPEVERTPRRREAPRKEDVECHVCGKSFKIDPRFSYGEYYRCNRCTGKK